MPDGFVEGFAIVLTLVTVPLELNPLLQAAKSWRSGTMEGVSTGTFAVIFLIGGLWLAYGVMIGSLPLIAGNAAKLLASSSVLALSFLYRRRG